MEISKQQDCSMTKGCSLQINSTTPLLRKMPTQLIEHVDVELIDVCYRHSSFSGMERNSAGTERETWTPTQLQSLSLLMCPACKIC